MLSPKNQKQSSTRNNQTEIGGGFFSTAPSVTKKQSPTKEQPHEYAELSMRKANKLTGSEMKRRRNVKEVEAAIFKKSTSRAYLLGHDNEEHYKLGMKYAKKAPKTRTLSIA
jgi:hypothetical protein